MVFENTEKQLDVLSYERRRQRRFFTRAFLSDVRRGFLSTLYVSICLVAVIFSVYFLFRFASRRTTHNLIQACAAWPPSQQNVILTVGPHNPNAGINTDHRSVPIGELEASYYVSPNWDLLCSKIFRFDPVDSHGNRVVPFGLSKMPSLGTLMIRRIRTAKGTDRIIVVEAFYNPMIFLTNPRGYAVSFCYLVVSEPSFGVPQLISADFLESPKIEVSFTDRLTFLHGQSDPDDSSRFRIPYTINGSSGSLIGELGTDDKVRLRPQPGSPNSIFVPP
ncbi:MAG TPA: hypothetical protein VFE47_14390 [Tepidisphaeraceae bacterium]|jgi:hypothetical protein|nr:hypothetical protein [Tepidisphaeraceae bacterium]